MSAKKVLYAIFFSGEGVTIKVAVKKHHRTVLQRRSTEETEKYYQKRRPTTGFKHVRLLHDNAQAHTSAIVTAFLKKEKLTVLPPHTNFNLVYRFTKTGCIVGLKMGLLLFVLPFIYSFFFLSRFFVKDISTTVSDRNFKFGIEIRNNKLYCGIANGHSPICSSLPFSFFPDFLHLSVVPFIHLSFCLFVLFGSLHKAIYITSALGGGVWSDFLTVLVSFCFRN